ncbi:benzoate-CoA ligase family protein [Limobrevibacterium gyesilva]|uniref:Benzoate-CoA ligase family protein n=1 Tax=Limobrevibacterium gyesilva TaxID=2991712 RepID=A0AA41YKP2_9PROT|nr:benzoate-CoA ligase family protein [Limobrevibacterium gyesilva]MCW3474375.1 benzoate-CoA ligase family protein [Limobrevibacterium gyesilva]
MSVASVMDSFARDNLPPRELWPALVFTRPELQYPPRLNCVTELLDRWVAEGHGDAPCLVSPTERLTYAQLQARVNRICNVLVDRLGMQPGHRVLLRSANNPMMVACYLAVQKAGGVVVATMPMLRAKEIAYPIEKARIHLALCDRRLSADMEAARPLAPSLRQIVYFNSDAPDGLEAMIAAAPATFAAFDTACDDVCLIGFTSGTTGEPKGTMHFHRDILAVCDAYGGNVLRPRASDRFIGSPPLAFTFGLGGLVLFPLRAGASTVLLERAGPDDLLQAIPRFRPTICFTAPTAYRAMLGKLADTDISSLRACVSAGETLPRATFEAWLAATGIRLMDGIGSTEMLHIFIAARPEEIRPGATGRPVPGYEAKVIDDAGHEVPDGTIGRLAVRGPTGCRYIADKRQTVYVQDGWNVTGDTYLRDADGYFWYQARNDDMIVSSGYNIAGPEVESALLLHPAVAECAVIGVPDADRGAIVKAYVVLAPGHEGDAAMTETLQNFVKATVAPYKYPRAIEYRTELPKTATGKLQRFRLRTEATPQP